MDITIHPRHLRGNITVIPSKSQAHRLLICAAFADRPTELHCPETNIDIEATAECLRALGADIERQESGYSVIPIRVFPREAVLPCRESGSTLRFLLPIVGAMGVKAVFRPEGRLPKRPLSPLWEEMERMGCRLSWRGERELLVEGKLSPGNYCIDGSVSSQFISGLLLAATLMEGDSAIHIQGRLESAPYVEMTRRAMSLFGVDTADFLIGGSARYRSPGKVNVEGDWSGGAFFLTADYLGSDVNLYGLDLNSPQGDRAVTDILPQLKEGPVTVCAADIPDLVPVLAVAAAHFHGAEFTDIRRLRLKESDRVSTTVAMIEALGGRAEADENTLRIYGTGLVGGTVDAVNDHRIAMSAAVAATVCRQDVTILGAGCVKKSYPRFWGEYARLGGNYEFNLR